MMERCKKNQLKQKKNYLDHLVKHEEKNVLQSQGADSCYYRYLGNLIGITVEADMKMKWR